METIFSYSLRKYLDDDFPDISRAVIIEDNTSFAKIPKPFVSIEYLGSNDDIIAAGRRSYEEIHRYQIGIFATSGQTLGMLSSKLRELLRKPDGVPIYDIATGKATSGRFLIDVEEYTPMRQDDVSEEVQNNRGYFVVAIEILREAGAEEYTQ